MKMVYCGDVRGVVVSTVLDSPLKDWRVGRFKARFLNRCCLLTRGTLLCFGYLDSLISIGTSEPGGLPYSLQSRRFLRNERLFNDRFGRHFESK